MAVVTAAAPTTTTMTIVTPSLNTVRTPPSAIRFGERVRRRAAGRATPAFVADNPFLHRERTLMPYVPGPGRPAPRRPCLPNPQRPIPRVGRKGADRKSTRLNSSHLVISY